MYIQSRLSTDDSKSVQKYYLYNCVPGVSSSVSPFLARARSLGSKARCKLAEYHQGGGEGGALLVGGGGGGGGGGERVGDIIETRLSIHVVQSFVKFLHLLLCCAKSFVSFLTEITAVK